MNTKLVNIMDMFEWDTIVNNNFPQAKGKYGIQYADETWLRNNGSYDMFTVSVDELDDNEYDERIIKEWEEEGYTPSSEDLCRILIKRGVMQPGNYLIEIWW